MSTTASIIAEITEQLEPIAEQLQIALDRANEHLNSHFAYQWEIGYAWVQTNWATGELERTNPQVITVPVVDFPIMFGEPYTWVPRPGHFIAAWTSQEIYHAAKQDYPPALEARNYFIREVPSIGTNTEGQTKNVYDIINLPAELEKFHEAWTEVMNAVRPLGESIESIMNLHTRGFTWSGLGHEAYMHHARRHAQAAEATQVAVQVITDGVFSLVDMVLRLVEVLGELAKKNIDDVEGAANSLISILDAKKWIEVVMELVSIVGQNLKDQIDAAISGAQEIVSDAEAIKPFEHVGSEMYEALQQPNVPGEYPGWPEPKEDFTAGWSGDGDLEVEIGYLSAASKAWMDVRDSLWDGYKAAVGGGDIPQVADQSGRFTELINLLNELKGHVCTNLLRPGAMRARAMSEGLQQAAKNYIDNENVSTEEAASLQDILDNPSDEWLEY